MAILPRLVLPKNINCTSDFTTHFNFCFKRLSKKKIFMKFKYIWYVVIDPRVMLQAQNIHV